MKNGPSWKGKLKDYWKRMYHSTHRKMSEGAQEVVRMLTTAHKDNWRKKRK